MRRPLSRAVYIASDKPLSLIPWHAAAPAFYVAELNGDPDVRVRRQFSKPYAVYAGSHEGCGCGFFKLRAAQHHAATEIEACIESLRQLGDYLDAAMKQSGELELFTSWEGDQGEPPEARREITTSAIREGDLDDHERQLCRVVRHAA